MYEICRQANAKKRKGKERTNERKKGREKEGERMERTSGAKIRKSNILWKLIYPPTSRMSRVVMSEVVEPSWFAASTQISYGVKRARLWGMWQEYCWFSVLSFSHSFSLPYHLDKNTKTKTNPRFWKGRFEHRQRKAKQHTAASEFRVCCRW